MMNEDKIDWVKVEKINGEIADIQAKMRTESMKFNRQAYDITGYETYEQNEWSGRILWWRQDE